MTVKFLKRTHLFARAFLRVMASRLLTHRPFMISHRITGRCNARCPTCLWRGSFEEEFDTNRIVQAYKRAAKAGFIATTFWGGEPLIRDDMPEIARQVRNLGFTVGLITNGFFLPERAAQLASSLDYLIVSLDLPGPEHDGLRRLDGVFQKALDGIHALRRLDPAVKIFINSVVSRLSYPGVLAMAEFAARHGLGVTFESTNTGASLDGSREVRLRLPPDKEREAFGRILAMKERGLPVNNSFTYLKMFSSGRTSYSCHNPKVAVGVSPDGSVTACLDRRKALGNFFEDEISAVLDNPLLGELQKRAENCSMCVDTGTVETSLFWELKREVITSTIRLFLK